MRAEHGRNDSDRHERPLARPRKQTKNDEEDDQPTYVVEDGLETLSKAEYDALKERNEGEEERDAEMPLSAKEDDVADSTTNVASGKCTSTDEVAPGKQHVAGIGASNKRKVAKVIGDDIDEITRSDKAPPAQQVKSSRGKKLRKVKLSFDENVPTA